MPLPRIYIETSVVSYLTARSSRDLLIAARQEATREWWELRGTLFHPVISNLVLREVAAGDPRAASRRLEICASLDRLEIDPACEKLASDLIASGALPKSEPEDALHIAIATLAKADFIATWNFAHLVGPVAKFGVQTTLVKLGFGPTLLATPEELLETL